MSLRVEDGIQVLYDDSVLKESTPYQVSIDQTRASLLLLQHGVLQETVNQTRLLIRESPSVRIQTPMEGFFDSGDLTISLYPEVTFNRTRRNLGDRPNFVFLHEANHLINYIRRPNHHEATRRLFRRVEEVAFVTGGLALLMTVGFTLLDASSNKNYPNAQEVYSQIASFGTIYFPAMISFYKLNPIELSAQSFASRLNRKPQWQSIVNISPK